MGFWATFNESQTEVHFSSAEHDKEVFDLLITVNTTNNCL
jgi:hypothetical protein